MPRRTSLTSALYASQRLAISLMKLILVASRQLATYLVISALSGDITRNGRSVRKNGAYSSCRVSATSGLRTPTTTRSGLLKSSIAAPSLRNSGLLATSNGTLATSAMRRASSALVPTGTVLLMTITLGSVRFSAICWPTAQTPLRSAPPWSAWGVPTATKMISASAIPVARSVENLSRPSR